MSLRTLAELTAQTPKLAEAAGLLPHPSLATSEIKRLEGKIIVLKNHVEAMDKVFEEVEGGVGEAYKLHHIAQKGDFDMAYFDVAKKLLDQLSNAVQDLSMYWQMDVQSKTDPDFQTDPVPANDSAA
jgi:hypothetical protein